MRLVRINRLFKALPRISFDGKILPETWNLFTIVIFPLTSIIAYALLAQTILRGALRYRCVPTDLDNENVESNIYYQYYGINYFYTEYNVAFCSLDTYRGYQCPNGYSCEDINLPFRGVYGDFMTPWNAMITNMSIIYTRNWPNIFWAVVQARGSLAAIALLLGIVFTGTLMTFNLFPVAAISFVKAGSRFNERIKWLKGFPGTLEE